jgi:hypothetical protein
MKLSESIRSIANEVKSNPEKWTQEYFAKNKHGFQTWPTDDDACRWCASGFIMRMRLTNNERSRIYKSLRQAADIDDFNTVYAHNDSLMSSDEFVAWFMDAADLLQHRGS